MVRNNIGGLVGIGSIPLMCNSVPDVEIQKLLETLIWVYGQWKKNPKNRIILEGDALGILTQFTYFMTCTCHPLLQDSCLLYSHFPEVHVRHMWEGI